MKVRKVKHPTLSGIAKVIRTFEAVSSTRFERPVAMMSTSVYETCGTPMCHAGWYAYSKNAERKADGRHRVYTSFRDGVELMAEDLGYSAMGDITRWADENPKIWGNQYGGVMFTSFNAFVNLDGTTGKYELNTIIKHWRKVERRLRRHKANK